MSVKLAWCQAARRLVWAHYVHTHWCQHGGPLGTERGVCGQGQGMRSLSFFFFFFFTFRTTSIHQAWNSESKVQVWKSNLAFASDGMSSLNWGNAGLWESLRVFMLPQLRRHAASFPLISKTVSTLFRQRWGWSGKIGETWRAREFMLALLSAGNTWKPDGTWCSLLSDNASTA